MSTQQWQIDSAHSGVHFAVRHMVVAKVRGQFSRWSGTVTIDDGDVTGARVEAVIDASSIETGLAERDTHLRSADFLDVANHPEIRFLGSRVEKIEDGRLRLAGDLTIRGVTRPVTLEVDDAGRTKDPWGNVRAGFAARTTLDRKDFGLVWNQLLEAGGLLVGDRVDVEIEVEAVMQAASQAA